MFLQGVLYDLFECLYSYMDNANLTSIPIYFISPVADSSLAYANIYAEWYEAKSLLRYNKYFQSEVTRNSTTTAKSTMLWHFLSILLYKSYIYAYTTDFYVVWA